jgi:hypothetical protein
MNTIIIFATTCHKYACFGGAHGDHYDLSDYEDYNEFLDAFLTNNSDEKDPELDLLDVDDATVWPWLKIKAHELPAVIEFLTLDDDDRELVADYIETSEKEISTAVELRKALAEAQEQSIGHWKSFEDFTWDEVENWLACVGVRDKNARHEILRRFNMDLYADELKQSYNQGSNGYIFIA